MKKLSVLFLLLMILFTACRQNGNATLYFWELDRTVKVEWYSIDEGCISYKMKKNDKQITTVCNSAVEIIGGYAVGND